MVFGRKRKVVPFRSAGELDAMAAAGAIVGSALVAVRAAAKPGVSTLELNAVAESVIRDAGAVPRSSGTTASPARSALRSTIASFTESLQLRTSWLKRPGFHRLWRDPRRMAR